MVLIKTGFKGSVKKGEVVTTFNGRRYRKYKTVPKWCSQPRRICIKCLTNSIHKNSNNYDSKICKECNETAS